MYRFDQSTIFAFADKYVNFRLRGIHYGIRANSVLTNSGFPGHQSEYLHYVFGRSGIHSERIAVPLLTVHYFCRSADLYSSIICEYVIVKYVQAT